tara:strand:+ start:7868 stop:8860 length:993 start_codon:yes stop_codon:yes gene_type:complete
MKQIKTNVLFLLTLMFTVSLSLHAQKGVRLGYIDTEYILENVPEYQEATSQLDGKVQKWKGEIESRLAEIVQKRKDLSNEKPLLTKELIDEREEDIDFEEKEILDYQQKRFGPNGDLMIQKKQLMQPIQDQIFAAVQDIADSRKYDVILDKSDVTMLYSAKQFDLSEQIIRSITRASKRTQVSSKSERKAAEAEETVPEEINEELEAREKALEDKRDERAKAEEARRQEILDAREARKIEAEAKRQQILADREKARLEKLAERTSPTEEEATTEKETDNSSETKTRAQLIEENRQKKLQEREARQKELEERKRKILEERQQVKDSLNNNK